MLPNVSPHVLLVRRIQLLCCVKIINKFYLFGWFQTGKTGGQPQGVRMPTESQPLPMSTSIWTLKLVYYFCLTFFCWNLTTETMAMMMVNSVWPDVGLKSSPICPKSSHSCIFLKRDVFHKAQNVAQYLDYFWSCQNLSKITQSVHTDGDQLRQLLQHWWHPSTPKNHSKFILRSEKV